MSEDVFINKTYKMNHFANCNTSFLVYRLECPCGFFYASWTKSRFKNPNYAMAVHYNQARHESPASLKAVALEVIPIHIGGGLKKLPQQETFWIITLTATKPPGLNEGVDF